MIFNWIRNFPAIFSQWFCCGQYFDFAWYGNGLTDDVFPATQACYFCPSGWLDFIGSLLGSKLLLIMENGVIIDLVLQAMSMAAILAGPPILALLITGLLIGILQAATSINETTVAFVPKLIVFAFVIVLVGPVSLTLYTDYIRELFLRIPALMA